MSIITWISLILNSVVAGIALHIAFSTREEFLAHMRKRHKPRGTRKKAQIEMKLEN